MENPLFCDWPGIENWGHYEETSNKEFSSIFPAEEIVPLGADIEEDDPASTVSKNHSQAEKRRRDRINLQLSHLRKLIPCSNKMDKAALLRSVVEQVKNLKIKAKEESKLVTVPSDSNEVTIDCFLNQNQSLVSNMDKNEKIFIRVSISCEDRPDLFGELTQVFKNLRITIISADISCMGGRIKLVLVLCPQNDNEGICISNTVHSLRGLLSGIISFSTGTNCNRTRSKRQRFFSTGQ